MSNRYLKINNFGGLDERNVFSDSPALSPDMNNFKVCENGALKKRPGSRKSNCGFNGSVYRMWRGYISGVLTFIVCAGQRIYKYNFDTESFDTISITAGGCHHIFNFGNAVYFLCDVGMCKYENGVFDLLEPYIPLVAVSTLPDGGGTLYEKANMLTAKKRQQFSSDGTSRTYTLAEKNIDTVVWVKVNGEEYENWEANTEAGTVSFSSVEIPPAGTNNVEICWEKGRADKQRLIVDCTGSMNFGGNTDTRVFLYGNPNYPNYRFYSELADGLPSAEYFPETNYTVIGFSDITDMVQQYDRQLIFTQDRAYYSYCELRADALGNYYSSFPVYNLNFEKGNLLKRSNAVIDNTPVTLSDDGLNRWVSTTIQDERNAECFSKPICETVKRIIKNGYADKCCIYDRQTENELYFSTPYGLFIYNYSTRIWYKYDAINAVQFCEIPGKLYWLNENGELYYFSDELDNDQNGVINAYWCTPTGKFGANGKKFDLTAVIVETDNSGGTDITVTAAPMETGQLMNSQTVSVDGSGTKITKNYKFRTEIKRTHGAKVTLSSSHGSRGAHIRSVTFKTNSKEVER